ncbi:MAG: hypothetical protein Ta2D_10930 [Rickettsiales bacterium]|nr:MAG: hypothetical protein Ta2D_10930 [Rickettsiales bacterium]
MEKWKKEMLLIINKLDNSLDKSEFINKYLDKLEKKKVKFDFDKERIEWLYNLKV